MSFTALLQGIAVVLALEGLAYAIAPGFMRRMLASLAETPEARLRLGWVVAAVGGMGLAWLLKLW